MEEACATFQIDLSQRAYDSEDEALEVAEYQMALTAGLELRAYFCEGCSRYHLTSKPQRY